MKILRTLALLTLVFTLTPSISYAQQDTVISVAFMTRDKNLWPDYRANKSSLDRLTNFLKRNPESKIFLNVTCASYNTTAENLAVARERLSAVKSQMAQRFPLEQFLHASKLSTAPLAGRADIAIIVVKKPLPETQDSTPAPKPKPEPVVAVAKATEPQPQQEIVIAAAIVTPAEKTKPSDTITTAAILTPAKKIEPAAKADTTATEKPVILAAKPTQPAAPSAVAIPTKEDEGLPIAFTADEIQTLINQADNFVRVPEFDIPIADGPGEHPQKTTQTTTYTNNKNLQPPVKYLHNTEAKSKKSPRKGK